MKDQLELEQKVLSLIPNDKFISKEELLTATGITDRRLRLTISNLKKGHTIISCSRQKGYRKAKHTSEMSKAEAEAEIVNVVNCIREIKSKKKTYNKQLRQYISYLRMLEKKAGIVHVKIDKKKRKKGEKR